MKIGDLIALIVFVGFSFGAGVFGSAATYPSIPTWYADLIKPVFTPPNWLFGPVWTLLYLLMAVSAYLIWTLGIKRRDVKVALLLFFAQLALNTLWSFLFFGWHLLALSFIEIIVLWVFILLTILNFYRLRPLAGWLMTPYILWVSYATVLTGAIWLLNR